MHTGNHYKLKEFLIWTRRDIYVLCLIAAIPTIFYQGYGWHWLALPWVPIALVGTAAAFLVGFKNTQTYNRVWEARTIWGAIVNQSRAWGILVRDCVSGSDRDEQAEIHRELIYRHIAWLTALRYQLREPRAWENMNKPYNKEYRKFFSVPEQETKLEDELDKYLGEEDKEYILSKKNRATHLISLQSKRLKELKERGMIAQLSYIEMENMLVNMYEQQGRSERIKNFPYPRQFASVNLFFIRLFVILVPFGMLQEFHRIGDSYVWLTIPFATLISWVFQSLERVGESTENPFEGGANDVPISSLSRNIEIDLREMLDETDIPAPLKDVNKILM